MYSVGWLVGQSVIGPIGVAWLCVIDNDDDDDWLVWFAKTDRPFRSPGPRGCALGKIHVLFDTIVN